LAEFSLNFYFNWKLSECPNKNVIESCLGLNLPCEMKRTAQKKTHTREQLSGNTIACPPVSLSHSLAHIYTLDEPTERLSSARNQVATFIRVLSRCCRSWPVLASFMFFDVIGPLFFLNRVAENRKRVRQVYLSIIHPCPHLFVSCSFCLLVVVDSDHLLLPGACFDVPSLGDVLDASHCGARLLQ